MRELSALLKIPVDPQLRDGSGEMYIKELY